MNSDWDTFTKIAGISAKLTSMTEDLEFLSMEKTPIIKAMSDQSQTESYLHIEENIERRLGRLCYVALLPDTAAEERARLLRIGQVVAIELEIFKKKLRKKTLDLEQDVLLKMKEAGLSDKDAAQDEKFLKVRKLTLEFPELYDELLDGFDDKFIRATEETKGEK